MAITQMDYTGAGESVAEEVSGTWEASQSLTIPTSKKASAFYILVKYNNTDNMFSCMDGINGNYASRTGNGANNQWATVTFNNNSIVINDYFTGYDVQYEGYVMY